MNLNEENAVNELSSALKNDPRNIDLKEKERIMMESEEVFHLSKRLEMASEDYSRAMQLKDKALIEEKRKALHEIKTKLDSNPLVKAYNEAYVKVRDLYMQVDDIVFGPYRNKTLSGVKDND